VRLVAQRSFEDLHSEHGPRVRRLCRLLLADPTEAEDVSQEVLLKLLQERKAGRLPQAWAPWLTRVTVNACRDRRRSGWWRWWRDARHVWREEDVVAPDATPEQLLLRAEARREIWSAFQRLSARQREVFALRHVEGLSTAEVAATLGLSEGSAKRHLFRAVHQLRAVLGGLR